MSNPMSTNRNTGNGKQVCHCNYPIWCPALPLPDHLQRPAEEPVEIAGQPSLLGDGLLDGLLSGGSLVAEIDQRGEHIVHRGAAHARIAPAQRQSHPACL